MPDAFSTEFTGERVIPGLVEDNLFNEHVARYRFAARMQPPRNLTILDAGCGSGYGTLELSKSGAQVLGIDISPEAISHAQAIYAGENIRFEQASCTAIPAGDGAFGLVAAFEVIEHLPQWRDFLREARRVLDPAGIFLVSTPNRLYYAEARQKAGPNPFHVHEFTEEEFRAELSAVFPHVKILLQNHVEAIAFSGSETASADLEIQDRPADPSTANFFLAVCGIQALPPIPSFIFIPETGNVLQTRERHIALLDGEIRQKNEWIAHEQSERARMLDKVRDMEAELEEHNRWARQANEEAERRAQLVADLQEELRRSNEWAKVRDAEAIERGERVVELQNELRRSEAGAKANIEQLQQELQHSNEWALFRDAEVAERGQRIEQLQAEVQQATAWAKDRDAEVELRGARIVQLQNEMAASIRGYEAAIGQWRREKEASDQWAMDTERGLSAERDAAREAFAAKQIEYEISQQRVASLQAELENLTAEFEEEKTRMGLIAQSRWVRLGRTLRVGPEIQTGHPEIQTRQ